MRSRSRHRFFPQLGLFALCVLLYAATASAKREHLVYFPNTAYELNIYKIHGKNPGKTLMIIGGIQGNEPGGFLSADLYADMRLEEVQTNLLQKQEIFLQINGQNIKTGEVKRVKDFFPNSSNKQIIEIKNEPMLLGSFVIEIG